MSPAVPCPVFGRFGETPLHHLGFLRKCEENSVLKGSVYALLSGKTKSGRCAPLALDRARRQALDDAILEDQDQHNQGNGNDHRRRHDFGDGLLLGKFARE